jgi:hypothetical protein
MTRDLRHVPYREHPLVRRAQCRRIDPNPRTVSREPARGDDRRRPVRRHPDEKVELEDTVRKQDPAGLDTIDGAAHVERDVPRLELLRQPRRAGGSRVGHEEGLQSAYDDLRAFPAAGLSQVIIEQHRAFEGSRWTRIRHTRDDDRYAPSLESIQRIHQPGHAAGVPYVVSVIRQARHEVGPGLGAQGDHQVVAVQLSLVGGDRPRRRVDAPDLSWQEANAPILESRPGATPVLEAAEIHQSPQLPQAHQEPVASIDEHDLVTGLELAAKLRGESKPAEAAPEDQCAGHVAPLPWFASPAGYAMPGGMGHGKGRSRP